MQKLKTKTVTQTVTKTIENTARIEDLTYKLISKDRELGAADTKIGTLEEDKDVLKGKVKAKNKKIWWLYVIIACLSAWILRRPIIKLINPLRIIPI